MWQILKPCSAAAAFERASQGKSTSLLPCGFLNLNTLDRLAKVQMVYLDEALMMDVDLFYAMDLLLRKAKSCTRRPFGGASVGNRRGLYARHVLRKFRSVW